VTAYQLDPGDRLDDGGLIIPGPWSDQLHTGQMVDVEIGDRLTRARIRWVCTAYAIADEVRP
jgi:hypothetical protein